MPRCTPTGLSHGIPVVGQGKPRRPVRDDAAGVLRMCIASHCLSLINSWVSLYVDHNRSTGKRGDFIIPTPPSTVQGRTL